MICSAIDPGRGLSYSHLDDFFKLNSAEQIAVIVLPASPVSQLESFQKFLQPDAIAGIGA